MIAYYADKTEILRRLFGAPVEVAADQLLVSGRRYEIVDDVILLIPRRTIEGPDVVARTRDSFGHEWSQYSAILPEHAAEFSAYFDLVDRDSLADAIVCDLGCGMGRWSYFLRDRCRALVLVDFSEAIFAARRNLSGAHACFFMGDVTALPFADDFADFAFSLGVLHHLNRPCLDEVRRLRRAAPRLLVYLYYALDNRPAHFRVLLRVVDVARRLLSRVRSESFRTVFAAIVAYTVYKPLILLGRALRPLGLSRLVPLSEYYEGLGGARIQQDVYDRFFTPIEQRVSRTEIAGLRDTFGEVRISEGLPFWHFLCSR